MDYVGCGRKLIAFYPELVIFHFTPAFPDLVPLIAEPV